MKKGFTLAEVLITLAVIGVVATLTLPNVIGNHQNKVLMTQLQKTINQVAITVQKSMEDTAAEKFSDIYRADNEDSVYNFLKTYFNPVTICTIRQYEESGEDSCLPHYYSNFDKTNANYNLYEEIAVQACATLVTGATICPFWDIVSHELVPYTFIIDQNGAKSPNVFGKDLFVFYVQDDGKLSYNLYKNKEEMQKEANGDYCTTNGSTDLSTFSCLPYIISHGWQFKF